MDQVESEWAAGTRLGELSPDGSHAWGSAGSWDRLWLRAADVAAVAGERFGLGVGEPLLLAEGLWNQSWRLTAGGGRFVLRVIRPDLPIEDVRYEHDVTARLRARIPEVVAVIRGLDGDTVQVWGDVLVVVFPFVDGAVAATLPAAVWEPWAATMLARLHRTGLDLGVGQRPAARRVDQEPNLWATVGPVLTEQLQHTPETVYLLRGLDAEAAALDQWVQEMAADGRLGAVGLVHGDYNPRNLLTDARGVVAVLDWETVQLDVLAAEVAAAVFAAERPDPYWRAYRSAGGPLDDGDLALLPGLARRQALLELQFAIDAVGRVKPQALRKLREVSADLSRLPATDAIDWAERG
jgi:Ser/Thr protein kinase RdoA (MazF antagonist)